MGGERHRKKLITPDDPEWFVMHLCSRWGKTMSEIESMPVSEFEEHRRFWREYRWGMTDDLLAMTLSHHMRVANPKSTVQPWMVKQWTARKDYTYHLSKLIAKPVTAIRSGFFAIYDAVKNMKAKHNGKHQ